MLDIGTGGGEFLSTLAPFPSQTLATEGYPPNFPIARARLEPLGVKVLAYNETEPLPISSQQLDLIINRHAGYQPSELWRVLKPGGIFITQQVGNRNCLRLNELLQNRVDFPYSYWSLDYALKELEAAGFTILDQREAFPIMTFTDIGAVVFFLKVISWQVEDFEPVLYRDKLAAIHHLIQENGSIEIPEHRSFLECIKEIS